MQPNAEIDAQADEHGEECDCHGVVSRVLTEGTSGPRYTLAYPGVRISLGFPTPNVESLTAQSPAASGRSLA